MRNEHRHRMGNAVIGLMPLLRDEQVVNALMLSSLIDPFLATQAKSS